MATIPIVADVISISISNTCAARNHYVISKTIAADPSPATIQAAVPSVVAIHKHAAFPILIWSAAIKASVARVVAVNEHV